MRVLLTYLYHIYYHISYVLSCIYSFDDIAGQEKAKQEVRNDYPLHTH